MMRSQPRRRIAGATACARSKRLSAKKRNWSSACVQRLDVCGVEIQAVGVDVGEAHVASAGLKWPRRHPERLGRRDHLGAAFEAQHLRRQEQRGRARARGLRVPHVEHGGEPLLEACREWAHRQRVDAQRVDGGIRSSSRLVGGRTAAGRLRRIGDSIAGRL
jgi:hypothetical protein